MLHKEPRTRITVTAIPKGSSALPSATTASAAKTTSSTTSTTKAASPINFIHVCLREALGGAGS